MKPAEEVAREILQLTLEYNPQAAIELATEIITADRVAAADWVRDRMLENLAAIERADRITEVDVRTEVKP